MRPGPDYSMWGPEEFFDVLCLRVPLELTDEWEKIERVNWHQNADGTILLTPEINP